MSTFRRKAHPRKVRTKSGGYKGTTRVKASRVKRK